MSETGRSRGRARGRANLFNIGANGNGNGNGGPTGRASVRGGPREFGAGEAPPTEGIQQLTIHGAREQTATDRPRRPRFQEYQSRPAHVAEKKGTSGVPQKMMSNYISLKTIPGMQIYQYHVDFDPPIDNRRRRHGMLREQKAVLGDTLIFDGMILYLPRKLEENTELLATSPQDGEKKTRLIIKLVKELSPTSPQLITMLNIFLRRSLELLEMKQVNRNYYMPQNKIPIPQHKLEIWPGYETAIAQYDSRAPLLNVDVSHKVLRTETVLDFLYNLYDQMQGNEKFFTAAKDELVGSIVLTRYNNRTYRVDDIDWDKHPTDTFEKKGEQISYAKYFSDAYGKVVGDMKQPLLICKGRMSREEKAKGVKSRDCNLLPELCTMTGLTDKMRSDFRVMKDMHEHTRQDPNVRVRGLEQFSHMMSDNPKVAEEFSNWGVQLERSLVEVQARILPPEKISMKFANGSDAALEYDQRQADWTRSMRGKRLLECVDLEHYLILFTKRDRDLAQQFCGTLQNVNQGMGIRTAEPTALEVQDRTEAYVDTLKHNIRPEIQIVICILTSNRKERYDAIKKYCCITNPIPSQVVLSKTLQKRNMMMSVTTKVAIQLNCKLGAPAWRVDNPLKGSMVIGLDAHHDSSVRGRSVGAFVASFDPQLTMFTSRTCMMMNQQEIVPALQSMMPAAMKKYQEHNGALPKYIFVYRDGVGDGMLKDVYETELPQINKCIRMQGTGYDPKGNTRL